ncbi:MAG: acetyl-CoA carboxylase biotin carboxyl carrier protein subunit, partial [Xanthobacteraceae bacterium]
AGDRVVRGQRLVVLEAMKMRHEIRAQRDGSVGRVLVETGQQVATRQLLVELEPQAVAAGEREERPIS